MTLVTKNLNSLKIQNKDGPSRMISDYGISNGEVDVVFRNIKERLLKEISLSEAVLGCVAWLTDFEVLTALQKCKTSIVVQKEDFLRPDVDGNYVKWKKDLHALYNKLESGLARFTLPGISSKLNTMSDPTVQAIRCVGNHNSSKSPAFPRMHNKFIVFGGFVTKRCEKYHPILKVTWIDERILFIPKKIWTGSFNFTNNAANSFENVVIITNENIANAYISEYSQIFAVSEQLNWDSEWIKPEFSIGT